jgi:RelE-like toxin of type II toxin-antitoxin system HigB
MPVERSCLKVTRAGSLRNSVLVWLWHFRQWTPRHHLCNSICQDTVCTNSRVDQKGIWSITMSGNWRITFRFEGGNAHDVNLIDYH